MMKKTFKIIIIFSFFILNFFSLGFSQENITISTYYPSPIGVYRVLKLDPGAQPVGACQAGEIYYKNVGAGVLNRMYLCTDTGWQRLLLNAEITPPPPLWIPCPGGICKNVGGFVGIGTAAPSNLLTISGAGTALHVTTGNAIFEQRVGINTNAPGYDLEVNGVLQADDYFSGDGSQGNSSVINVVSSTGPCTISFEDGLVVATTCP